MGSSRAPAVFFGTLRSSNSTCGTPRGTESQHGPRQGVYCCLCALLRGQVPTQLQPPLCSARNIARDWLPGNSAGVFSPPCLPQTPDLCLPLGLEHPPCRVPFPPSLVRPSHRQQDSPEPVGAAAVPLNLALWVWGVLVFSPVCFDFC